MIMDARNALPTFDVCFQNWLDSQTDDDLREACEVGSDLLEFNCGEEMGKRQGNKKIADIQPMFEHIEQDRRY